MAGYVWKLWFDLDAWMLGVANGSSDEFSAADAADAVWTPTNSWSAVRRELTETKPTLTIKDVIPAQEVGMEKILAIKPLLSGGQSYPVEVEFMGKQRNFSYEKAERNSFPYL